MIKGTSCKIRWRSGEENLKKKKNHEVKEKNFFFLFCTHRYRARRCKSLCSIVVVVVHWPLPFVIICHPSSSAIYCYPSPSILVRHSFVKVVVHHRSLPFVIVSFNIR
jgi:hypothetical protein